MEYWGGAGAILNSCFGSSLKGPAPAAFGFETLPKKVFLPVYSTFYSY